MYHFVWQKQEYLQNDPAKALTKYLKIFVTYARMSCFYIIYSVFSATQLQLNA